MERSYQNSRIAFIHGRPAPHPSHATLAESVNADFYFVDEYVRYHDRENSGKIRRYTSWLLNSVFMKNAHLYDLIVSEGIHFPPIIRKRLGMLNKRQKVAAMLGDETMYFLKINWYSSSSHKAVLSALAHYDALICLSEMQAGIARGLLNGKPTPRVMVGHEAIGEERFRKFGSISPRLDGKRILFVSHGPSGWRGFYKGIETLLETIDLIAQKHGDATLTVVGEWEEDYINMLCSKLNYGRDRVRFVGAQKDLAKFFQESDLYVQLANGDAFPVATLESLRAGLPVIVSEWTGTKEAVGQIDPRLIVPVDAGAAAERIEWYFDLPLSEKMKLSDKGREVVSQYSEQKSCAEFRSAVDKVLNS